MTTLNGHASEPWKSETWNYSNRTPTAKMPVVISGDHVIATMKCDGGNDNPYTMPLAEAQATAARIVACVNGCEGINPEAVPDLVFALEQARQYLMSRNLPDDPALDALLGIIDSALAKPPTTPANA